MPCTVCQHPERQGSLFKLNVFLELATLTAQTASAEGNFRVVLQAISAGTRIIQFMAKSDFALDQETVYRLLASPDWAAHGSLLPTDPQVLAGCRQSLADRLFSLCPESPVSGRDAAEDCRNEADPASLADLADLDGSSLDLLHQLFPGLAQILPPTLEAPNPEPAPPLRQWKKSGKKPEKSVGSAGNNKQKYNVTVNGKITGKTPGSPSLSPVHPCLGGLARSGAAPAGKKPDQTNSTEAPGSWVRALDQGWLDIDALNAIGAGRSCDLGLDPTANSGKQTVF